MLSNDTIERMKRIEGRITEVGECLGIPREEAVQIVAVDTVAEQVGRVALGIDTRNQKRTAVLTAAKRAVMQFLKGIGWLD